MESWEYRTDDLPLAVLLGYRGYSYVLEKLTQNKALWVFSIPEDKEEDFNETVDAYEEFRASVEPRRYVARWAEMRNELFAILPPRPGRRPAPAT